MIRQYFIINCDLAISRYDFVNKTAAAVGFRIIRFLPYLECGIIVGRVSRPTISGYVCNGASNSQRCSITVNTTAMVTAFADIYRKVF